MRTLQDAVRRRAVQREPVAYIPGGARSAAWTSQSTAARSSRARRPSCWSSSPSDSCPSARACSTGAAAAARSRSRWPMSAPTCGSAAPTSTRGRSRWRPTTMAAAGPRRRLPPLGPARRRARRAQGDRLQPALRGRLRARVPGARDPAPRAARRAVRRIRRAGRTIRALLGAQTAARERVRLLALEIGAGQASAVSELDARGGL